MLGKYHGLFTDKFDVNMATPVFIDSIGTNEEENKKELERLSKEHPNAVFHIDDIY